MFPIAFGPRVDVERNYPFLPDRPQELIRRKQFNHVPHIIGANENEGSLLLGSKIQWNLVSLI